MLGNPTNFAAAGSTGRKALVSGADQFAADILPLLRATQSTGSTTLEAISRALNSEVCALHGGRDGTYHPWRPSFPARKNWSKRARISHGC